MRRKTYIPLEQVRKFMARQDETVQAEYARLVLELETTGFLAFPQAEKIESGLFAIRMRRGGNVRVFYIYDSGTRIYGIHAYAKKTQAIPDHELRQARNIVRRIRG